MRAYRARWVIPIGGAPIPEGVVLVEGGTIRGVLSHRDHRGPAATDLGDVTLLPAWVNAHTHLEFSDLESPLGQPGISFPRWIGEVVAWRRKQEQQQGSREKAIARGCVESRAGGTALIGEIASPPFCWGAYREAVEVVAFQEQLGRGVDAVRRSEQVLTESLAAYAAYEQGGIRVPAQLGLSPHAPYSVGDPLFDGLLAQAAREGWPVAMHLAETLEERELMESGGGPFAAALQSIGAWYPDSYRPQTRPLDYLVALAKLPRVLVVHGNYLAADEMDWIARHRDRMTVVYCPRTHRYFEHPPYPLAELWKRGIRVAVGTDSRASNPDLSVLEELRCVARQFPELPPERVIEMGTQVGAEALGRGNDFGALAAGFRSWMAVVTHNGTPDDPYAFLTAERAESRMLEEDAFGTD